MFVCFLFQVSAFNTHFNGLVYSVKYQELLLVSVINKFTATCQILFTINKQQGIVKYIIIIYELFLLII